MKLTAVPTSLALDRTASSLAVHLAIVLATSADEYGFVRESQKGLALRLSCEQDAIVTALRDLRDRNLIVVSKDDIGYLYHVTWISRRAAAPKSEPKHYLWVEILQRGHKKSSWVRLVNPPPERDNVIALIRAKGDEFLRLKDEPPKALS